MEFSDHTDTECVLEDACIQNVLLIPEFGIIVFSRTEYKYIYLFIFLEICSPLQIVQRNTMF